MWFYNNAGAVYAVGIYVVKPKNAAHHNYCVAMILQFTPYASSLEEIIQSHILVTTLGHQIEGHFHFISQVFHGPCQGEHC